MGCDPGGGRGEGRGGEGREGGEGRGGEGRGRGGGGEGREINGHGVCIHTHTHHLTPKPLVTAVRATYVCVRCVLEGGVWKYVCVYGGACVEVCVCECVLEVCV